MAKIKVFIVNKSAHDFSKAEDYGEVFFVTEGWLDRFNTTNMHRHAEKAFKDSSPNDWILPCALNTLNSIVCATFAVKHGRLNLLLWKARTGEYLKKEMVFR